MMASRLQIKRQRRKQSRSRIRIDKRKGKYIDTDFSYIKIS